MFPWFKTFRDGCIYLNVSSCLFPELLITLWMWLIISFLSIYNGILFLFLTLSVAFKITAIQFLGKWKIPKDEMDIFLRFHFVYNSRYLHYIFTYCYKYTQAWCLLWLLLWHYETYSRYYAADPVTVSHYEAHVNLKHAILVSQAPKC